MSRRDIESKDQDDGLPVWERNRAALHRDIDAICDAWPHALTDLDAIGFRSRGDGLTRGGSELTSVEAAANELLTKGSKAVAWVAELGDLIVDLTREELAPGETAWTPGNARRPLHTSVDDLMAECRPGGRWDSGPVELMRRVDRLAATAQHWWPKPPRKGDVVDGVTVGERGNTVEQCGLCAAPVHSGRDADGHLILKRDASGIPFHAACYYEAWRSRQNPKDRPACSVDDCDLPAHAKELCRGHYNRWRRTGVLGGSVGITGLDKPA